MSGGGLVRDCLTEAGMQDIWMLTHWLVADVLHILCADVQTVVSIGVVVGERGGHRP